MSLKRTCLRSLGICVLLMAAGPALLRAEKAILEGTADASLPGGAASAGTPSLQGPGTMFFGFKTWNIFHWRVESAELYLHVLKGAVPTALDIAVVPRPWVENAPPSGSRSWKYISHTATAEPQGWISVKVDPKLIEEITAGKGHGLAVRVKSATAIHTRESSAFVPYLIVNGGPQ